MLISTIPIQRIRSGFGKTLGDSLQPWILEWILFGATLRGMERGIWFESDKKKILLGKVTNYFTNLQVAEFKLESFDLKVGDEILIQGPTTGTIQMKVPEIRVDLQPVEKVEKEYCFRFRCLEKSGVVINYING